MELRLGVLRRLVFPGLLVSCFGPQAVMAQAAPGPPPVSRRVATLTAGIGNVMGWFGVHGERYFAGDRLSGFAGLGYTPALGPGDPSGPTFALGLRGFTGGVKHRGFLALSVSQLVIQTGSPEEQGRLYGPGLEVGYQFVARRGFTFMGSLGVGYAPGVAEGEKEVGEVFALGFGYTWRRKP